MPAANVKWGRVRSCGCLHMERLRKKDITGCRYGRLTAIRATADRDTSGSVIWECKCECGTTVYYSVNRLLRGNTLSCGCFYRDTRKTCNEKRWDAVDGTLLSALAKDKRLRADNTSGHVGVCLDKRSEKWKAYINFQKKRYNLGFFETKEQAIQARVMAEERLFDPFIREQWDIFTEQTKKKYLIYLDAGTNDGVSGKHDLGVVFRKP